MSRRATVATPLLVIAVAVAVLSAGAPAAIAADAGAVIVTITDRLEPATVDVAPGTVIVWKNTDSRRHRVRSREGPAPFDSGNLEPGEVFSVALADEGAYLYVDERHEDDPGYVGRITVGSSAERPAPSAAPTPETTPLPRSSEAAAAAATDVAILDRSFSPATVSVTVGDTVTWTNTSDRDHTVTFSDEMSGSDVLAEGGTFRQTFRTPGSFSYICAIHPEMTGTVSVTASPAGDTGVAARDSLAVASFAGQAPLSTSMTVLPRWIIPFGVAAFVVAASAVVLRRRRRGRTS